MENVEKIVPQCRRPRSTALCVITYTLNVNMGPWEILSEIIQQVVSVEFGMKCN